MTGAESVGRLLGSRAKAAGITKVVFDRGASSTTGVSPYWPTRHGPRDWSSEMADTQYEERTISVNRVFNRQSFVSALQKRTNVSLKTQV